MIKCKEKPFFQFIEHLNFRFLFVISHRFLNSIRSPTPCHSRFTDERDLIFNNDEMHEEDAFFVRMTLIFMH